MNWQATGAITEIIAAIGVILSLIYLAKQIRMTRLAEKKRALESTYLVYNDLRNQFLKAKN